MKESSEATPQTFPTDPVSVVICLMATGFELRAAESRGSHKA